MLLRSLGVDSSARRLSTSCTGGNVTDDDDDADDEGDDGDDCVDVCVGCGCKGGGCTGNGE
jgi:hypothetical protein